MAQQRKTTILDDLIAAPWWVVVQKRQRDRSATILNLDCVGLQATEGEAICELSTGARTFLSVVQRVGKRVPLFFLPEPEGGTPNSSQQERREQDAPATLRDRRDGSRMLPPLCPADPWDNRAEK